MHKILVIEHNLEFRTLMAEFLTCLGYEVTLFSSARKALQYIQSSAADDVDLILSDLHMPDMNGMELLLATQEHQIPMILMTSNGTTETHHEAKRNGAAGFLIKPFPLTDMADLVKAALKK